MSDRAGTENESTGRKADFDSISPVISNVFAKQSELPRLIAAETGLFESIMHGGESALLVDHKAWIIAAIVNNLSKACTQFSSGFTPALNQLDPCLQKFTAKLYGFAPFVSHLDVSEL